MSQESRERVKHRGICIAKLSELQKRILDLQTEGEGQRQILEVRELCQELKSQGQKRGEKRSDEESAVWACLYTCLEALNAGFIACTSIWPEKVCSGRPEPRHNQHTFLAPRFSRVTASLC